MADWMHPMCEACYSIESGLMGRPGVLPSRLAPELRTREICCLCHDKTRSGIYERKDPADCPCKGNHPETKVEIAWTA